MFGTRRRTSFGAGAFHEAVARDPQANALTDCLAAAFASLPEIVRRAHHGTVQLSGPAQVERGRGLGGLIAALLRLPRSNPTAELVVVAWHFPDQIVWSRTFDGRKLESTFVKEGALLVEHMGAVALHMLPVVEGGRLVYRLEQCRLGPITLPRALAPALVAWEGEKDGKYTFEVDVRLPLFGRLIRYSGLLDVDVLAE